MHVYYQKGLFDERCRGGSHEDEETLVGFDQREFHHVLLDIVETADQIESLPLDRPAD